MTTQDLDRLCSNALRVLAMDAIQKANSGHPGMPMGMADVAYILWTRHMRHNPKNPQWPNRDRFVLSAGHGSMLLYALLYLSGYPLTMDDLKQFRQWGSKTPGHPEYDPEIGVEMTTGPLGQGFATGVGMAIAEKHLAALFNRPDFPIIDNYIYAIVSDGDLMEGVSHEAASLAGHLKLDRLIYLYDDNHISIEGNTRIAFTEDVAARFRAYGWHVQEIDGHDFAQIDAALTEAKKVEEKPHLIICHTHIAYGSPHKQDTAAAHGSPLGEEEIRLTKEALGWPSMEPFFVPKEVIARYRLAVPRGEQMEAAWRDRFERYAEQFPDEAAELQRRWEGRLPEGWEKSVPHFTPEMGAMATRAASGKVLNALADAIPELIGGSADLAPSNKTHLQGKGDFQAETPTGRNLHFGVREFGMGAAVNGMALYGGVRPFGATFLVFSDYMRGAVRLAALMKLPVVFVWTHDSIFVGEDGPTHQPIEHLASLRAMPNLTVIRPADANETAAAWQYAMSAKEPVALILTRQKLPTVPETDPLAFEHLSKGAYILRRSPLERTDILLLASGSEVHLALEAQRLLAKEQIGAQVVSMPSWELFERQSRFYQLNVLPPTIPRRLAIEAGSPLGWERYVGERGAILALDHFGASAPASVLGREFGFTAEMVVERAKRLLLG